MDIYDDIRDEMKLEFINRIESYINRKKDETIGISITIEGSKLGVKFPSEIYKNFIKLLALEEYKDFEETNIEIDYVEILSNEFVMSKKEVVNQVFYGDDSCIKEEAKDKYQNDEEVSIKIDLINNEDILYDSEDFFEVFINDVIIELLLEEIDKITLYVSKNKVQGEELFKDLFYNSGDLQLDLKDFIKMDYEKMVPNLSDNIEAESTSLMRKIEFNYAINYRKIPKILLPTYYYGMFLNPDAIEKDGLILNKKKFLLKNTEAKLIRSKEDIEYYKKLYRNFNIYCESFWIKDLAGPLNISVNVFLFNKYIFLFDVLLLMDFCLLGNENNLKKYAYLKKEAENKPYFNLFAMDGMLGTKKLLIENLRERSILNEDIILDYLTFLKKKFKETIMQAVRMYSVGTSLKGDLPDEIVDSYKVYKLFQHIEPYTSTVEKILDAKWLSLQDDNLEIMTKIFSVYCKLIYDKKKETKVKYKKM